MECNCNALEIITNNGGKYTEKLIELYNSFTQRSFIACITCYKKPSPKWIWESLSLVILTKEIINTDMLKFIETKKCLKVYNFNELEVVVEAGHLDNVRYIIEHGIDFTIIYDLNFGEYYTYGTLVEEMWKRLLKKATDKDVVEYLQLQLKISEINVDIEFSGSNYANTPCKEGIKELKVMLEERKTTLLAIVREKRKRTYSERMKKILAEESVNY